MISGLAILFSIGFMFFGLPLILFGIGKEVKTEYEVRKLFKEIEEREQWD